MIPISVLFGSDISIQANFDPSMWNLASYKIIHFKQIPNKWFDGCSMEICLKGGEGQQTSPVSFLDWMSLIRSQNTLFTLSPDFAEVST